MASTCISAAASSADMRVEPDDSDHTALGRKGEGQSPVTVVGVEGVVGGGDARNGEGDGEGAGAGERPAAECTVAVGCRGVALPGTGAGATAKFEVGNEELTYDAAAATMASESMPDADGLGRSGNAAKSVDAMRRESEEGGTAEVGLLVSATRRPSIFMMAGGGVALAKALLTECEPESD